MNIDVYRLQPNDMESHRQAICALWLDYLLDRRPMDVEQAMSQVYDAENTGLEVLREQAAQASAGLYVAYRGHQMISAARIGISDTLGLGSMLSGGSRTKPLYVVNYGTNSRRTNDFRSFASIAQTARHDLAPAYSGKLPTHLRMYLDESEIDDTAQERISHINPETYEQSAGVVNGRRVGGIDGDYRLHSVQFPTEESDRWQRAQRFGESVLTVLRDSSLSLPSLGAQPVAA